jgi:hypothetical protein
MPDAEFLSRWLEIRAEAITRIAGEIRRAQAAGFCPGIDPVLTASALSAMLEHFCYIWLGQGANGWRPASTTSVPPTPSPPSG